MEKKALRIGTRGSKLALWQANHVQALLQDAHPDIETEIIVIQTTGDWKPSHGEVALEAEKGGKALFAKEIEEALLDERIDIAVHSLKDMDSILPAGLKILSHLPREDARDVALFRDRNWAKRYQSPSEWPAGSVVGTVSPRRQAQLEALNPHLSFTPLRGNVGTRISKLRAELAKDFEQLDVTILAAAGLKRLGLEDEIDQILDISESLPAASQGIIAIEGLKTHAHWDWDQILAPITCNKTSLCALAERATLQEIGAGCHTAIGVHASFKDDLMYINARWFVEDKTITAEHCAKVTTEAEAIALGTLTGETLQ